MKCHRCETSLVGKPYYAEQTGWARYRGATGGTNHLYRRRGTDRFLCESCLHVLDQPKQDQLTLG